MVIAVIDTQAEPDHCARLVGALLPRSTTLLAPTLAEVWETGAPVPPLSGVLVHRRVTDLKAEEQEAVRGIARRFPLAPTDAGEEALAEWAERCRVFSPQLPRRPDRVPWAAEVTVADEGGGGEPRPLRTLNVSFGGVFVEDPGPPPRIGRRVALAFPSVGPNVRATGEVRWTRPGGYGCKFVDTERWVPGLLVNAARTAG